MIRNFDHHAAYLVLSPSRQVAMMMVSVGRLPSCVAVFNCFLLLSFFEVAAAFADLYPGANTTASLVYQTPHASNASVSSLAQEQKPKTSLTSGSNVVTVDPRAQLVNLANATRSFSKSSELSPLPLTTRTQPVTISLSTTESPTTVQTVSAGNDTIVIVPRVAVVRPSHTQSTGSTSAPVPTTCRQSIPRSTPDM